MLVRLSQAVAARPIDLEALCRSAQVVETELGREVLVEAVGVAGAFEAFTKIADSTGKEALPDSFLKVIGCVLGSVNKMRSWLV